MKNICKARKIFKYLKYMSRKSKLYRKLCLNSFKLQNANWCLNALKRASVSTIGLIQF